ncbi:hypothetical protein ACFRAM_08200 [Paenibacillus sp. NPDC056722]|uniref:hypothetical protein n=1 Tax=Paenibacillus sp. NPDC056722 TaxID=3345924 RepID=UPI0036965ED4
MSRREKGFVYLASLILAVSLQLISVGVIESSIFGNLPVLGNILFAIDVSVLIYHLSGGATISVFYLIAMRFVSVLATILTLNHLSDLKSVSKGEALSPDMRFWLFIIGILINAVILYFLKEVVSILFGSIETINKQIEEISDLIKY